MELAFQDKGVNNFTFEHDPHLMSLINKAAVSPSTDQQVSLIHQAASVIYDQVYDNVLFMQNPAVAYRDGCTGWQVKPSVLLSIISPQSLATAKCSS
jgi:peptide/nickel transport system substrate-binding protein